MVRCNLQILVNHSFFGFSILYRQNRVRHVWMAYEVTKNRSQISCPPYKFHMNLTVIYQSRLLENVDAFQQEQNQSHQSNAYSTASWLMRDNGLLCHLFTLWCYRSHTLYTVRLLTYSLVLNKKYKSYIKTKWFLAKKSPYRQVAK